MRWLAALVVAIAGAASGQDFDHSHAAWNALVKKHVVLIAKGNASQVRYADFARDRSALKTYLDSLSGVPEAQFNAWPRARQMAFLINAYNAFTVELILANYPVKSIKDIGSDLFNNRWKKKFFRLFGRDSYLDQIEHEMLREPGRYDDPRVHFALNCASVGCPMLREEAYLAERLDAQLEQQAVRFLSDRSRNRVSAQGTLELSRIFDWYKDDWSGRFPGIASREAYFAKYAALLAEDPALRKRIADGRAPLTFLEYDWALNDAPR